MIGAINTEIQNSSKSDRATPPTPPSPARTFGLRDAMTAPQTRGAKSINITAPNTTKASHLDAPDDDSIPITDALISSTDSASRLTNRKSIQSGDDAKAITPVAKWNRF